MSLNSNENFSDLVEILRNPFFFNFQFPQIPILVVKISHQQPQSLFPILKTGNFQLQIAFPPQTHIHWKKRLA